MKRRLANVCPTRWNYSSRLVNTVFKNRSQLCDVFNAMIEHPDEIESDILAPVNGFLAVLEDLQFVFFLTVFGKIFSYTDVLFDVLKNQASDIVYCRNKIKSTRQNISRLREDFEINYNDVVSEVGPPKKRKQTNYRRVYCEVFDNVDGHFQTRFDDYSKLDFLQLLVTELFPKYEKDFPEVAYSSLLNTYGRFFDQVRLRNELIVFYSSEEFKGKTLRQPCKLCHENLILKSAFPQINLLVSLIYSIPVSTASVERSFSALERIKTFSRNSTGSARLSHLGLISIEYSSLEEVKIKEIFFDEVVSHFASKDRRMDFKYR